MNADFGEPRIRLSCCFMDTTQLAPGLDLHGQQRCAKRLTLSVGAKGDRTAAAESAVQEEVQGSQVGEFEALDGTADQIAEMAMDTLRGDFAEEDWVIPFVQGDDPDVAGIALVTGARVCDLGERPFHAVIVAYKKKALPPKRSAPFCAGGGGGYAWNELPQPQVDLTCGLLNLNPAPSRVST
jgi:hypothetical protein